LERVINNLQQLQQGKYRGKKAQLIKNIDSGSIIGADFTEVKINDNGFSLKQDNY